MSTTPSKELVSPGFGGCYPLSNVPFQDWGQPCQALDLGTAAPPPSSKTLSLNNQGINWGNTYPHMTPQPRV